MFDGMELFCIQISSKRNTPNDICIVDDRMNTYIAWCPIRFTLVSDSDRENTERWRKPHVEYDLERNRDEEKMPEKPERRNLNTLCDDDRTEYAQCTHSPITINLSTIFRFIPVFFFIFVGDFLPTSSSSFSIVDVPQSVLYTIALCGVECVCVNAQTKIYSVIICLQPFTILFNCLEFVCVDVKTVNSFNFVNLMNTISK